ncbi:uncharacterized protein B4U79_06472 [Dinothrombium tinctorium]|uniref:Mitochondrial import inner membrane translocase subunit Tim29-like protein n=1 Tax=Dinothrombium tinctorium TaxID=1965070 RepID=A0A443RMN2_9ACAR|nr:uncharacterized protein B4U79_06472 [Dinothrombium tinctorium]
MAKVLNSFNFSKFLKAKSETSAKWGGKRMRSYFNFWRQLIDDYKTVATDVIEEVKAKPAKACLVASSLCFIGYCVNTNPDHVSFTNQLLESNNELALTSSSIRNVGSYEHVMSLNECVNKRVLRLFNCGLFSFIWRDDYSANCDLYRFHCSYLKPSIVDILKKRIVDVGFLGSWRVLKYKMIDFDVNEDEWKK